MPTSRIPQLYTKTHQERLALLKRYYYLNDADIAVLLSVGAQHLFVAERMVENVIGTMTLPLGIATNFLVNGVEILIPMVTEEASVVAAASHAAKLARDMGGFTASITQPIMVGQIQLVGLIATSKLEDIITQHTQQLLKQANGCDPILVAHGGGALLIECVALSTSRGIMHVVRLHVDVCNAMGSNIVNTMVEAIAPTIEQLTGLKSRLKIVSNAADQRLVKVRGVWNKQLFCQDVIAGILDADAFAHADSDRAITHNKGIMNGVDAVAIATGNDFRALEAAAHGYAAKDGKYKPLSHYYCDEHDNLVGELVMPIPVGIVGGITKTHPLVQTSLNILRITSANELAQIIAAVGLAQNFAALRALVSEGIQRGHMKLHSKNIAAQTGAQADQICIIAERMVQENCINTKRAHELYAQLFVKDS